MDIFAVLYRNGCEEEFVTFDTEDEMMEWFKENKMNLTGSDPWKVEHVIRGEAFDLIYEPKIEKRYEEE